MREKILADRYLQPGETEDDMYWRVAKTVANGDEALASQFYDIMGEKLFLPNTPTLVNAGTGSGGLSACYVLPIHDSLDSIYKALVAQGHVHKSFGGTGFDFSELRPKGTEITSTGGSSTGPIGFMELFNANAEAVRQGGKREGANMGILRVDHPDIEEFIDCKTVEGKLTHFNISVAVTKEFMDAVLNDEYINLRHAVLNDDKMKFVKARSLMDKIVHNIWKNGEPGIVFIDEINKYNQVPSIGNITATNPCGEQPLLPYESCNLGSINLAKFVNSNNGEPYVLWDKLANTTKLAVQFLNNVIDINNYPIQEIEDASKLTRKIGLGVMGWHDMLIKMGIPYDSNNALTLADEIMKTINGVASDTSVDIAVNGDTYPAWLENSNDTDNRVPMANATLTTIAPTGSLSLIAECSSGVEPVFAWKHTRHIESGDFEVKHPTYDDAVAWDNSDMMKTSMDILVDDHIKMQAAFQKHVHNAVSKTINLPNNATVDDIDKAIMFAYVSKCKGVTLYRNGSRDEQVLSISESIDNVEIKSRPDNELSIKHRPNILMGKTSKHRSGCGSLFITVNELNGEPYELFVHHSSGGCQSNMEAIGRLITLSLKSGVNRGELIAQLDKVKCITAAKSSKSEGNSCAQIIGMRLLKFSEELSIDQEQSRDMIVIDPATKNDKYNMVHIHVNACPECGGLLTFGEGCMNGSCPNCGWSGCS